MTLTAIDAWLSTLCRVHYGPLFAWDPSLLTCVPVVGL